MEFISVFDIFTDCFVYGSIAYWLGFLTIHLVLSLTSVIDENQTTEPDFYEQVKELLNPATEEIFQPQDEQPCFETMTLRELKTHIKVNHLHQEIKNSIGKTVSNARKHELITALS